jgi:UDP-N-acetylglucosamine 4,6-dehydratase
MFDDAKILITGGTGSWGHELVTQLIDNHRPSEIRIFSRGEHRQVEMRREFNNDPILKFIIGDVRSKDSLVSAMSQCDYVFHLAALKHVPVCEENSWEAVLTNVYGTQNVIEAAVMNNVKTVVDVSTDKAVEPHNQYGVTKSCGEKLIVNANQYYESKTKFVCIRGGNVMGTAGSVLPLFKRQLETSNEITITDATMTRYLMSTREAIQLVFNAVEIALGGEIFVLRMPAVSVDDIARAMTSLFGDGDTVRINIGPRPGEKVHEVLISKHESSRALVIDEMYYVILPQFDEERYLSHYRGKLPLDVEEFTSENARRMTLAELQDALKVERWRQN